MNWKNYLLAIASIGLLLSACNKNDESNGITGTAGEPTSLTISLKGNSVKNMGQPTQLQENTIADFTVCVYNGISNILEKIETFDNSDFTRTINGLTTGPKKIVVIANKPGTYTLPVTGANYSDLTSELFDLSTQTTSTNLLMSCDTTTTLTLADPNGPNLFEAKLRRVVAKVQLGSVTYSPEAAYTGTFTLDSVYIMKARGEASVHAVTTGAPLYGGIDATASAAKSFLAEKTTLTATGDSTCYFYVFPNDNTGDNATLITLVGTYDGTRMYYPFRVNYNAATQDGTFIKRNEHHVVNVTIKKPSSGVQDPEETVDPASLEITVVPQNWIVMPVQSVEW